MFLAKLLAWQRRRARAHGIHDPHAGAITFVQRLGSLLNSTATPTPWVRTRAQVMMPAADALRLLIDGMDGGGHRGDPIDPGYGDIVAAAASPATRSTSTNVRPTLSNIHATEELAGGSR